MAKNRARRGAVHQGGVPIFSIYAEILVLTVKYPKIIVYYTDTTTCIKLLLFALRTDVVSEKPQQKQQNYCKMA